MSWKKNPGKSSSIHIYWCLFKYFLIIIFWSCFFLTQTIFLRSLLSLVHLCMKIHWNWSQTVYIIRSESAKFFQVRRHQVHKISSEHVGCKVNRAWCLKPVIPELQNAREGNGNELEGNFTTQGNRRSLGYRILKPYHQDTKHKCIKIIPRLHWDRRRDVAVV